MQPVDYVILAAIVLLLVLAIRYMWKHRGKGCSGCSGCSGGSGCSRCEASLKGGRRKRK